MFLRSSIMPWKGRWVDERKQGKEDSKWLQYIHEIWFVVSNLAILLVLDQKPNSNQEMQVCSPDREDLWEKKLAIHFHILARRIPWTEEPSVVHRVAKSQTRPSDKARHSPILDVSDPIRQKLT